MFHCIIVEQSLKDKNMLKLFDVISSIKDGSWTIYKLAVPDEKIEDSVEIVQSAMDINQGWYSHLYNHDGSKLLIVYKEKVFPATSDPKSWHEAVEYGKTLNIPDEQLDFAPCIFDSETF